MDKILVTGTMAFDTLETPYGKREKILGGSANYFSVAASHFTKLELCSVIGSDFPEDHINFLNKRCIGTSNVCKLSGQTFHWIGQYEGMMNEAKTLDTHLNVLLEFNPELNEKAMNCEVLFLANVDPVIQLKVIEKAKKAKLIICDTMNFWISSKPEDLLKVLKKVDILVINETEARMLSGEKLISTAIEKVAKLGPKAVVVKRGEYGAMIFSKKGGYYFLPAYPIKELKDPTGAGDTFAGGFTGYLATAKNKMDMKTLKKAMMYGTVLASYTVQDFGLDALRKVTKAQMEKRYKELNSMVTI
jgi:sugar/nucleoside kinase (ribokinase family)